MQLLLDTHVLLWAFVAPDRLSVQTRSTLEDQANEVMFSAASIWEIAIKSKLGRVDFLVDPPSLHRQALAAGFVELPVHSDVALRVAGLPLHHRDPFDRLLIAQAMAVPAHFYTADRQLRAYTELVRFAD